MVAMLHSGEDFSITKNKKKRKRTESFSPNPNNSSDAKIEKSSKKKKSKEKKSFHEKTAEDDDLDDDLITRVEEIKESPKEEKFKEKKSVHKKTAEDDDLDEDFTSRVEAKIEKPPKKKKFKEKKSVHEKTAEDDKIKSFHEKTAEDDHLDKDLIYGVEDFDEIHFENLSSLFPTPLKKVKKEVKGNSQDINNDDAYLLKLALEQVRPSTKRYGSELSQLNYQLIGSALNEPTAEIKLRLKKLIKDTFGSKCLHRILRETLDYLSELKKEKQSSCFNYFLIQNKEEIEEAFSNQGEHSRLDVALQLWQNLSEEEKQKYTQQTIKQKLMSGKTPLMVFADRKRKKNPFFSLQEARTIWNSMKAEKKNIYILKSVEIMMALDSKYEESAEKRQLSDDFPMLKKIRGPTKEDVTLLFQHLRLPDAIPKLPAILYYKETQNNDHEAGSERKDILFKAINAFKNLTPEERQSWHQKHQKVLKDYKEELKAWKKDQDITTLYLFEKTYSESTVKKTNMKKKTNNTMVELHKIEMPLSNITFHSEPIAPPLTPVQLFSRELERTKNEKLIPRMAKQIFSTLDNGTKDNYKAKIAAIRQTYVAGLRDYVSSMIEEQKKLFLGLRRARYIQLLKEDIFADYPSSEYPLYVRPSKEKPSTTVHEWQNENGKKALEGEEEEEEIMMEAVRKKISLQIPREKEEPKGALPNAAKKSRLERAHTLLEDESSPDSEKSLPKTKPVVTLRERGRMNS